MSLLKKIEIGLGSLGFFYTGKSIGDLFEWLRKIKFKNLSVLKKNSDNSYSYSNVKFTDFQLAREGTYGILYLAYRIKGEDEKYVFIKSSPNHKTSLLFEGIIQTIAQITLEHYGFPKAVPKIYDIINHPEYGTIFAVEKVQNAILFADYLKYSIKWEQPCEQNDIVVLSVIAQVATYMAILEKVVGLNHRDLKSDNVLMVVPQNGWSQTVQLEENVKWTINADYAAILIDFGFSCIGESDGTQVVSAGEYFPKIDFCPKKGRDLFYMLSTLWNLKAFRNSITPKTKKLFHKWLRDNSNRDWPNLLKLNSENNLRDILLLSCSNDFYSEASEPKNIIHDISIAYPQIVRFTFII
jgi:serine/threonine protein kinase